MSAGFHYMGWILGIHCFRLTSLDVYQWPNGHQLGVQVRQGLGDGVRGWGGSGGRGV